MPGAERRAQFAGVSRKQQHREKILAGRSRFFFLSSGQLKTALGALGVCASLSFWCPSFWWQRLARLWVLHPDLWLCGSVSFAERITRHAAKRWMEPLPEASLRSSRLRSSMGGPAAPRSSGSARGSASNAARGPGFGPQDVWQRAECLLLWFCVSLLCDRNHPFSVHSYRVGVQDQVVGRTVFRLVPSINQS